MTIKKKRFITIMTLAIALIVFAIASIFIGSSHLSFVDGLKAVS